MKPLNAHAQNVLKSVTNDLSSVHGKIYPGHPKALLAVIEGPRTVSLSYRDTCPDTGKVVYDPIYTFWRSPNDGVFYFVSFRARTDHESWAIKLDRQGNPAIIDDDVEKVFAPNAEKWLIKINEIHRITNQ